MVWQKLPVVRGPRTSVTLFLSQTKPLPKINHSLNDRRLADRASPLVSRAIPWLRGGAISGQLRRPGCLGDIHPLHIDRHRTGGDPIMLGLPHIGNLLDDGGAG